MTDWEAINKQKRREINLGMAKNGAIQILNVRGTEFTSAQYKKLAETLFQINEDMDKKIL